MLIERVIILDLCQFYNLKNGISIVLIALLLLRSETEWLHTLWDKPFLNEIKMLHPLIFLVNMVSFSYGLVKSYLSRKIVHDVWNGLQIFPPCHIYFFSLCLWHFFPERIFSSPIDQYFFCMLLHFVSYLKRNFSLRLFVLIPSDFFLIQELILL